MQAQAQAHQQVVRTFNGIQIDELFAFTGCIKCNVRLFMVVFATYTLCLVRLRLTAKLKLAKHFLLLIELFSTFSSISFVQMSTRTFS